MGVLANDVQLEKNQGLDSIKVKGLHNNIFVNRESVEKSESDIKNSYILVVDDLEMNRKVLGRHLTKAGFDNIEFAENGEIALQKVAESNFDILLLDIMMPGIDGFEVCQRLRSQSCYKSLPILVQTALDGDDDRSQAFAAGATDVISKPINGPELIARLHIHLENKFLVNRLTQYHDRLADELEVVQQLQQDLVPNEEQIAAIQKNLSLRLSAHFQPSSEVGGDLWAAHELSDGRLSVFLCDLTGHGVVAAVNAFRLHVLIDTLEEYILDPGCFLTELNKRLVALLPVGTFATAFHAIIDPRTEKITYAAAATHTVQIMSAENMQINILEGDGVPLGILANETYETIQIPFPYGSSLLCYSDALVEVSDSQNRNISNQTVKEWFHEAKLKKVDVVEYILNALTSCGITWLADDLTIVSVSNETE